MNSLNIPIPNNVKLVTRHSYRGAAAGQPMRLWISPENRRQMEAVVTCIASITGRRPSLPVILRAGVSALQEAAVAASKEHGRAGAEGPGKQVSKLLNWLAAAASAAARSVMGE